MTDYVKLRETMSGGGASKVPRRPPRGRSGKRVFLREADPRSWSTEVQLHRGRPVRQRATGRRPVSRRTASSPDVATIGGPAVSRYAN